MALLLTNGRAYMGAVFAGLLIMTMFVSCEQLRRLIRRWIVAVGAVVLRLSALIMHPRLAELTGRDNIWPALLERWQTSPLLGVGGFGVSVSGGIT